MKKLYLLMLVTSILGCWSEQTPLTFTTIVKTYEVKALNYYEKQFVGTVGSAQNANLAFEVGGLINNIYVSDGDNVTTGQLLASLNDDDFRLELASALAQYQASEAIENRAQRLHSRGAISTQELDIAKADYHSAKSNYQYRVNRLEDTKLYAPFAGSIQNKYADTYEQISAGTIIFRLSVPNSLEVKFTLPEGDVNMLLTGVEYFCEFDNIPNKIFPCRVVSIIDGSPSGGGLPITLAIDDNSISKLVKPGFSAKVIARFVETNDFAHYTVVPLAALSSSDTLWIYNPKDSTVTSRKIKTAGLKGQDMVIISEGLNAGEIVVSAGVNSLQEGMRVKRP